MNDEQPATSGNEEQTTDGNNCRVEGGKEQSSQGSTSHARTWQERFLNAMRENFGNIFKACCAAKVSRLIANRERAENKEFADAWDEIQEGVTDRIEERGIEQAIAGEPRLIPFFLGARRRQTYGEKVEITGALLHAQVPPELLSQKAAEALQSFSPLMLGLPGEKVIDVESEQK